MIFAHCPKCAAENALPREATEMVCTGCGASFNVAYELWGDEEEGFIVSEKPAGAERPPEANTGGPVGTV